MFLPFGLLSGLPGEHFAVFAAVGGEILGEFTRSDVRWSDLMP